MLIEGGFFSVLHDISTKVNDFRNKYLKGNVQAYSLFVGMPAGQGLKSSYMFGKPSGGEHHIDFSL